MLSGSIALSIYTLPQSTCDFNFIVNLQSTDAESFLLTFKEGYYCDADAIKEAIVNQGIFNIIDHASGFKADFVILKMNLSGKLNLNGVLRSILKELRYLLFHQKIYCFLN